MWRCSSSDNGVCIDALHATITKHHESSHGGGASLLFAAGPFAFAFASLSTYPPFFCRLFATFLPGGKPLPLRPEVIDKFAEEAWRKQLFI